MSQAKVAAHKHPSPLNTTLVIAALGLAAASIIKELRQPAEDRTWHGFVAGVVPYDYRVPTFDRAKATLWDPEGPAVKPHLFGVGWVLNLGRLVADAKTLASGRSTATV